ncbi:MAG: hypothetical protein IPK17_35340 [Chloroflexi bacterium]|uniref:hypothetical protein n=1 Tax=Candidatus Flexifilum breve TaxID=3140694 RepID=UPI0031349509|nr:hypothetical protein [Chloroflexota bacterium]
MHEKDKNKIRFTVGFTPDQAVSWTKIHRTRSRKGRHDQAVPRSCVRRSVSTSSTSLIWSDRASNRQKDLEGRLMHLTRKSKRAQFAAFVERDASPDRRLRMDRKQMCVANVQYKKPTANGPKRAKDCCAT